MLVDFSGKQTLDYLCKRDVRQSVESQERRAGKADTMDASKKSRNSSKEEDRHLRV